MGDQMGMDEGLTAAPAPERADVSVLFGRYHEGDGHQMAHDAGARLAHLEQIYERWVSAFSEYSGFSPGLVVPDPARAAPGVFRLFRTGSALLRFVDGSNGFCSSWPEGVGEEHADLISILFRMLRDWMNTSNGQSSVQDEPDTSRALDEHIKKLAKGGWVVGARERFFLLTGGADAKPLPWRIVDVRVQPVVLVWVGAAAGNDDSAVARNPDLGQRAPLPSAGIVPGQER